MTATLDQSSENKQSVVLQEYEGLQLWQIPAVIELALQVLFLFNNYVANSKESTLLIDEKGKTSDVSEGALNALRGCGFTCEHVLLVRADGKSEKSGVTVGFPGDDATCEAVIKRAEAYIGDEARKKANDEANKHSWEKYLQFLAKRRGEEEARKEKKRIDRSRNGREKP